MRSGLQFAIIRTTISTQNRFMPRKLSSIAADWWDYTTLDDGLLRDVAKLTLKDLAQLSRPGFKIVFYDTLEDFYLAEAL